MSPTQQINYSRAAWIFCVAYVVVTVLAIALSIGIGMWIHAEPTAGPMQNQAYLMSERFLPAMNLVVWALFAALYFRTQVKGRNEAVRLGIFWTLMAIVVDYVGFVLIKNPLSLSPHDFYIGQAPWIYLIYLAILLAPGTMVAVSTGFRSG